MTREEATSYEDVVQLAEDDEEFFAALMIDPRGTLDGLPSLTAEAREEVEAVIYRSVGANQKGAKTWMHTLLHAGVWRR